MADYPNNSSNNLKVRLPAPIRLNGEWKVALASISVPDPKNSLPDWLTDSLPLVMHPGIMRTPVIRIKNC